MIYIIIHIILYCINCIALYFTKRNFEFKCIICFVPTIKYRWNTQKYVYFFLSPKDYNSIRHRQKHFQKQKKNHFNYCILKEKISFEGKPTITSEIICSLFMFA